MVSRDRTDSPRASITTCSPASREERKLKLEIVEVGSAAALLAKVAAGEVHVGAGGLYRPPAGMPRDARRRRRAPGCCGPSGFYAVEPVLIYTTDGFKPKDWKDLAGATVAYVEGTGIEASLAKIRARAPGGRSGSRWRCRRRRR